MNTTEQGSNAAADLPVLDELKERLRKELKERLIYEPISTMNSVAECADTFLEQESGPLNGKVILLPSTSVELPESHLTVEDLNSCKIAMAGLFARLLLAEFAAKYGVDLTFDEHGAPPNQAREGE